MKYHPSITKQAAEMFIQRDFSRTENDDFVLNVQDRLGAISEAVPIFVNEAIVGWKIQSRYE